MIEAKDVRAQVVDINRPSAALPTKVVVDANVLYFGRYPNFAHLQAAGGRMPQSYQRRDYPPCLDQLTLLGCEVLALPQTLGELIRLVEYAELEALWLTDPATPSGSRF